MAILYKAVKACDLSRVTVLVGQGEDINQLDGEHGHPMLTMSPLCVAAKEGYLNIVRFLVEQRADMEKTGGIGLSPLHYASGGGHLEVTRYLLEQGANREKVCSIFPGVPLHNGTSLHYAAYRGHLEIAKLLMVYGADLNVRDYSGKLPTDYATTEEIKQAIRDEPRRRLDHGLKRATEQDRQEDEKEEEQGLKQPGLDNASEAEKGEVADDEDQDSERSSDEEDDKTDRLLVAGVKKIALRKKFN